MLPSDPVVFFLSIFSTLNIFSDKSRCEFFLIVARPTHSARPLTTKAVRVRRPSMPVCNVYTQAASRDRSRTNVFAERR